MSITVTIRYWGRGSTAEAFARRMTATGIVDAIRAEDGNEAYEYFIPLDDPESVLLIDRWRDQEALDAHHASPMMSEIARLRDWYDLHMEVTRYTELDAPESDSQFVRP